MVYDVRPEDEILGFAAVIREGADEPLEVYGYAYSPWRSGLYRVLCALTLGLLPLVTSWKQEWYVQITCTPCQLSHATVLVVKDSHSRLTISEVKTHPLINRRMSFSSSYQRRKRTFASEVDIHLRYFIHQHLRYVWNPQESRFARLSGLDRGLKCVDLLERFQGYSKEEEEEQSVLYGRNSMELEVKSVAALLLEKVLHPFYVFQIVSIIVWLLDLYYFYAGCIIAFSVTSITLALHEARKQMLHLGSLVSRTNEGTALVVRANNEVDEVSSTCLVPGDIICLPTSGCLMTCDAVLTAGNCLVNESLLTGESVPVVKTPLLPINEEFSAEHHRRHVLFRGTQVLQTRYYGNSRVTALVVRTGFSTAKGSLVRSILFAQPAPFRFYRDAILFVVLLFAVASIGMAYTLYLYIIRQVSLRETVLRALDIVTIAVPPALPAAMTVASVYAQKRLRRASIYCVSPHRINIAGNVDVVCFDKTGTLTDEGLDLWGIVAAKQKTFLAPIGEPCEMPVRSPMVIAMATCHTLTSVDGELVGDPLDLTMFRSTRWVMEEPATDGIQYDVLTPTIIKPRLDTEKTNMQEGLFQLPQADPSYEVPFEVGIIRQFPFSSSLQRMSVVCRTLGSRHMELYAKGAPEVIQALCVPETVPAEYFEVLRGYTLEGFRVVAVAYRRLEKMTWHHVQRVDRLLVENDLTFLGFLIMQNMLKPEATPVIGTLHGARIRCLMVTGDHLMTALSVARDCEMVFGLARVTILTASADRQCSTAAVDFNEVFSDSNKHFKSPAAAYGRTEAVQFAVDGHSFSVLRSHFPDVYEKLLVNGVVFARMTPQQKVELVEDLQSIGYAVAMCGDGANDCGALKAADVGISLSEAEASVAAPFTSRLPSVACVPTLIREGRCALATSFSMFQFISLYSVIQFLSVILLYNVQTNFSDPMFLYVDLFVITSLAITMSYAEPCADLSVARPSRSLLTAANLSSLLLQLLLVVLGQVGVLQLLQSQSWYEYPSHDPEEDVYDYWDVATLFFLTCYQYVVTALVFTRGPPFQKPFWTNYWFLGNLLVIFTVTTILLFQTCPVIVDFFELVEWQPHDKLRLRLSILLVSLVHWALAHLVQMYIVKSTVLKNLYTRLFPESALKTRYEQVEEMVREEPDWLLSNATMVTQMTNFDIF
ncbi:polyamine-transporting ATPase 13A3 isoform X1 [Dermacentor silvarum]|uniref:polyamine-transporting ATPase 13A3 isoform X1 n=1 Tax=Dermacentor silvarum TaxID=543639 RepID=UPI0018994FF7|nr:polyamine-transporting ATPase 13A3 isoform X1 [Dermacentor silvarum]